MDKYIQEEQLTFALQEEMFVPSDFKELCFANYTSANADNYLNSDGTVDIIDLLEDSNPVLAKTYILNRSKNAAFLDDLRKSLPDIFTFIQDEKLTIDNVLSGEYPRIVKVLFKKISFLIEKYLPFITSKSPSSIFENISPILANNRDFITFITFVYIHNHFKTLKISGKRQEKLQYLLSLYGKSCLSYYHYIDLTQENKKNYNELQQLKKEIQHKDKIITSKKNELLYSKKSLEEYKNKCNTLEKNQIKIGKGKAIQNIRALEEKNRDLNLQLNKIHQTTVSKLKYEKLQNQHQELNNKYSKQGQKLKELTKKVNELQSISLENKLEDYLKTYGLTQSIFQIIHDYYEDYINGKKTINRSTQENVQGKIGYCKIKDGQHYFIDTKGQEKRIYNIPDTNLIGEKQFILVDDQGNFLYQYNCYYTQSKYHKDIYQFGSLMEIEGKWFAQINHRDTVEIANPKGFDLKKHKMVAMNEKNQVLLIYKTIPFTADYFLKSALARNQQVYLVEKFIQKGMVGINLHSAKETFVEIECDLPLKQYSIIFVKNGKVIKVLDNPRFYTTSSLYKNYEYGVVEIIEENIFFVRNNGERLLLKHIPTYAEIHDKDVVIVDQYLNFIRKEEDLQGSNTTPHQKMMEYRKNNKTSKDNNPNKKAKDFYHENILIIGNNGLSNSYKLNLLRAGYQSEVISGFESWNKISKAIGGAHVIVFVTKHASHENYYKLKQEIRDKKILYSNEEGTNRIVELLNNALRSSEEEVASTEDG